MNSNTTELKNRELRGYEVRELIGEGGFGAVYRAFQPTVGREVAIKVIRREYANQIDFIRKFETEAQIIARLEHFHIVPLYDYWRDPDGAYFVMRFLRGGTVRSLLAEGAVEKELLLRLLEQMTSALTFAHRNKIIHRDLKPDNIMLDNDRNAYLADFGIARLIERDDGIEKTQIGAMVGSPAYSAPEQVRGDPDIAAAADQYSLGMMTYEMLTGVHPFSGSTVSSMLIKQLNQPIPSVSQYRDDLPTSVDEVLARATAKDPNDRYRTVMDFQREMRDALHGYDASTTRVGFEMGDTTIYFQEDGGEQPQTIEMDMNWADMENPYKGLRAFQEADADDFYGRDELIDQLLLRFKQTNTRFLALVGPSGSGKSSVVKAGLIPALRQGKLPGSDQWFIVEMFPGAYPLEELEATLLRVASKHVDGLLDMLRQRVDGLVHAADLILPDDGSELVIYVDQFEEMFTFVESEVERAHMLQLIQTAVEAPNSRIRVIVTLRADFYDRPLLYPEFGAMFRQSTEVVLPMSESELEEAIIRPAQRIMLQIEPALVNAIVSDVRDQPGALPLLQYALTELFERRTSAQLTLQSYIDIGGALGALARRADDIYIQLDDASREVTRQMFLRLVTLGEGTEDTRRRVMRYELISLAADPDSMERVIALFSRYRLITLDRDDITREPTVEIAHESLIREWSNLRDWLNSSREDLRMQRRVMHAAEDWRKYDRDVSYLAIGTQLETFEAWAQDTDIQLTDLESEYLTKSVIQREQEEAAQKARQLREEHLERRNRNIQRMLIVVLVFALFIAIGLSVFALNERNIAQHNATIAARSAAVARSSSLSAQARLALLRNDVDLAVVLALEATAIEDPPPIAENILFDVAYTNGTRLQLAPQQGDIMTTAELPSLPGLVYGTDTGTVGYWNTETGVSTVIAGANGVQINAIAVGLATNEIIVGSQDGTITVYNVETQQTVNHFGMMAIEGSNSVVALAVPPIADHVLVGLQNGDLLLVNLTDGSPVITFGEGTDIPRATITAFALDNDSERLAVTAVDRSVTLWDVSTGTLIRRFEDYNAPVRDVVFSRNGNQVISAAQNGEIFVHNANNGTLLHQFGQVGLNIWEIALAPDGNLFTGGQDGVLRQWNIENHVVTHTFTGHTANILTLEPIAHGGTLISGSTDGTLRLWNMSNGQIVYNVDDTGSDEGGVFSLDLYQNQLVSGGSFGSLGLWDAVTGESDVGADERIVTSNTTFTRVLFLHEGTQVVAGARDGGISLWDVASGTRPVEFDRHLEPIQGFALSADETRLVTSSRDGTVRVWDVATGSEIDRPFEDDQNPTALAFSPDGKYLLVGFGNGDIRLLDANTYEQVRRIPLAHTDSVTAIAFSDDSTRFATGSADKTAIVYDTATGNVVQRLAGHEDSILALAFSQDGTRLLTASGNQFVPPQDTSIRYWDIEAAQQLRRFGAEHEGSIYAMVLSEDNKSVYSADSNSRIIKWQLLPLDELRAYTAQNR